MFELVFKLNIYRILKTYIAYLHTKHDNGQCTTNISYLLITLIHYHCPSTNIIRFNIKTLGSSSDALYVRMIHGRILKVRYDNRSCSNVSRALSTVYSLSLHLRCINYALFMFCFFIDSPNRVWHTLKPGVKKYDVHE